MTRRGVAELRAGHDRTREVDAARLAVSRLAVTTNPADCADADAYIIAVPTPVDARSNPDLGALMAATRTAGHLLRPGAGTLVVYESTVYPGVTEDICGPELERVSGLKRGVDFRLGYSPERSNPGDPDHDIETLTKVVAGETPAVTAALATLYGRVTTGGVFPAASIKAAEAAKVIENAQRDINIAFMNEVTQIFGAMELSIHDVMAAAATKWNALPFRPGLVGGHCIGVDPYYLAHKAQALGLEPHIVLAGRAINDGMALYVADRVHAQLPGPSAIAVLGVTFKAGVGDVRNSKVADVVRRLLTLGHTVHVHDPLADPHATLAEHAIALDPHLLGRAHDAVLLAVPHDAYRTLDLAALVRPGGLVADPHAVWRGATLPPTLRYWTL